MVMQTRYDRVIESFMRGSLAFKVDNADEFYTMLIYLKLVVFPRIDFGGELGQMHPDRKHFEVYHNPSKCTFQFPYRDNGKLPENTQGRERFEDVFNPDGVAIYLLDKYGEDFNPRDEFLKLADMEWLKELYRIEHVDILDFLQPVSVAHIKHMPCWSERMMEDCSLLLNSNTSSSGIRFTGLDDYHSEQHLWSSDEVRLAEFKGNASLNAQLGYQNPDFGSTFKPYLILNKGKVVYVAPSLFDKTRTLIEKKRK